MSGLGASDEAGILAQQTVEVRGDDDPTARVGHVLLVQCGGQIHDCVVRLGGGGAGNRVELALRAGCHQAGQVLVGQVAQLVGGVLGVCGGQVVHGLALLHVVDLEREVLGLVDDEFAGVLIGRRFDGDVGVGRVVADADVRDAGDVHGVAVVGDVALVVAVHCGTVDEVLLEFQQDVGAPQFGDEIGDGHLRPPSVSWLRAGRSVARPVGL